MAAMNLPDSIRPAEVTATSASKSRKHVWTTSIDGCLRLRQKLATVSAVPHCMLHNAWRGPAKAVSVAGGHQLQVEFFLGKWQDDCEVDPERTDDARQLLGELRELAIDYLQLQSLTVKPSARATAANGDETATPAAAEPADDHAWSDWEPPPRDMVLRILAALGHEVAVDDAGHLRTSLKRRGCDLPVRAVVKRGELRFRMPLGQWSKVSDAALNAMLVLAAEANDRCRLARIAWNHTPASIQVEAQVDLTGLPTDMHRPACAALWENTLAMTMTSLELALRRLGLELPILAESAALGLEEEFSGLLLQAASGDHHPVPTVSGKPAEVGV